MRNIRCCIYASLALIACLASGCKPAAAPAPAAPGAVAVPGAPAAPMAANVEQPATATDAAAGPAGAPAKVDPQIQQKLLALGAKLKQDGAATDVTRNDLKQVGLGFHNYHDTNNGFPALNGKGEPDTPNPGLSWRVLLLPYVDESALYDQFHFDEPWDSEHNKTLITRMPKVYGRNAEGKTRLHVMTGLGAPFQMDQKVRIQDITDGTSNTILAFVGGEDTAEIWTKPTGREFDPQHPMKALGNVGDSFQILFMDGSVRKLPKSIKPQQFALLAQHQDGTVIGELPDPSGGGAAPGQPGGIKINPPVTPLAAAPKIDLALIPPDAFLAMAVHPRRIHSHPVIQNVLKLLPANSHESMADGMPWDVQNGFRQIGSMRSEMGIAPENIDEVIVVLDKSLPEAMMSNPFAPPPFGVIVRNSAPLDVDAIIGKLTSGMEGVSIVEHEGVAMILGPSSGPARPLMPPDAPPTFKRTEIEVPGDFPEKKAAPPVEKAAKKAITPDDPCQAGADAAPLTEHSDGPSAPAEVRVAIAFVSDSVIIAGTDAVVRKMISARASTTANTGLTRQIDKLGNPLFALAVDAQPIAKGLKTAAKGVPNEMMLFTPYVLGINAINLAWDLDAKDHLNLSVQFKNPDMAQGLFGLLDAQYQGLKEQYVPAREMLKQDPGSAVALPFADQLVNETKFAVSSDTISLVVPQIKDLDKLPELLKPAIDQVNKAAEQAIKKNNLKQIGLAFHIYHDSHTHFPALNGSGVKGQPSPGLSWRVYLLPYVDESRLYDQFKMDEPWDSPTNTALIKQMPKVYGVNAEGKTTIHVFTGTGAPFQMDKGVGLADITDGSSNTILAVEAGDETAEIWTKPTGLTFDAADPLKCLGAIKEFQALLFDGSVRRIKNVDKETFSKLIQNGDGMAVEIPE